ncbi:hypothetical protein MCERE19_03580 [Spirosomataceae bacterium]
MAHKKGVYTTVQIGCKQQRVFENEDSVLIS